jgi:two-component system, NtrC family, response regulator HydG
MKAADLRFDHAVSPPVPGGCDLRLGGHRGLLFDAAALGTFRKEVIDSVGVEVARSIFTRFGFAQGHFAAKAFEKALPWDDPREWHLAGPRINEICGLFTVDNAPGRADDPDAPFAGAVWRDGWEVEQHLLHCGRSPVPVCWTGVGTASGYLSHVAGEPIYCLEVSCRGRGDPECRMIGRTREGWGDRLQELSPFYEGDALQSALESATRRLRELDAAIARRRAELRNDLPSSDLSSRSSAMRQVYALARRVSRVDVTVLVTGESGVGKERIAKLIHQTSPRAKGPFVPVDCGSLSRTLLESELFGHARGSFTGAVSHRAGIFESAAGGTVLLDEIGELPIELQVKLLRVLQEHEVRRVGESTPRPVDVRIVAATHVDLAQAVREGKFREDLYYRLGVVEVHVPPLRERRDDILPLARSLLRAAEERMGERRGQLTPAAAEKLLTYDWPGNVRELENAMERAVALRRSARVDVADLPPALRGSVGTPGQGAPIRRLEEVEREYVLAALDAMDGNRRRTADALGIGVATLYRRLRAWSR